MLLYYYFIIASLAFIWAFYDTCEPGRGPQLQEKVT